MTALSNRDVVDAVGDLTDGLASGTVQVAELERLAVHECAAAVALVNGPGDPLWPVHVEIARRVLAAGGLTTDELAQWVTVRRRAELGDVDADEGDEGTSS